MPLNPQIANFPPLSNFERSWEQNLRALASYLVPGAGARAGLKLGIPVDGSGNVTSGLTPTLTDGYLLSGDQVLGPYGSKIVPSVAASQSNAKIWFGLSGMYVADAAEKPTDILIGVVTTDADSIVHVAQPMNYGAGRYGVRGMVNLAKATDGADQTLFDMAMIDNFDNIRVVYAQARVHEAATAGFDAGDDHVVKVQFDNAAAVTLATVDDALLDDAGTIARFAIADGDAVSAYKPESIKVLYNQTDTATAIAGGAIETFVEFALF